MRRSFTFFFSIALSAAGCSLLTDLTGLVGPPLEGFGNRIYITGRFANTEPMLERWIVDPPALVPATAMPSVGVDEHDARNMAAYLLSLR